jgi:hypothetical protein
MPKYFLNERAKVAGEEKPQDNAISVIERDVDFNSILAARSTLSRLMKS